MLCIYLRSARSGIAARRKSHCRCPIVQAAISCAVGILIIIALAAASCVIQILRHPRLAAYRHGIECVVRRWIYAGWVAAICIVERAVSLRLGRTGKKKTGQKQSEEKKKGIFHDELLRLKEIGYAKAILT
jgi:hypothetical protein